MLSLSTLLGRGLIYKLFQLARFGSGVEFKVGYLGRVYVLTVTKTSEKYNPSLKKRPVRTGLDVIDFDECSVCQDLMVGGLCLNKVCDNYLPAEEMRQRFDSEGRDVKD